MPGDRDDASARRNVVPAAAGRTLWLAAAWTGAGAVLLAAIVSIAAVAVCWLPASGVSGSAGSAIRAGVLTFLAAVHGGITLDGVHTAFVPLAMTALLGLLAWRAGRGLADAADDLGESRPRALLQAAALQAFVFAALCAVAARLATLGTSSAPILGVGTAALLLFGVTGTVAFVRWSALGDAVAGQLPSWLGAALRAGVTGVAVYLGAGALLVAGAVVVQHDRVEALSRLVGGGWSGVPVLLLGVLAAPNAAIAGASYLAGPGFALGSGNGVSVVSTAHGTLPAFPVLGAVPSGPGATWPVWLLVIATPVAAGICVAASAKRADRELGRWRVASGGAAIAAVAGVVLAWQGGGAIGSGRLNAIGPSPWRLGLGFGVEIAGIAAATLAVDLIVGRLRARRADPHEPDVPGTVRARLAAVITGSPDARDDAQDEVADRATADTDGDKIAG